MRTLDAVNKKVICDTNVWYDLATRKFCNVEEEIILVPTWIACKELMSTPKIKEEFPLIKGAISEILIRIDNGLFDMPLIHLNQISGERIPKSKKSIKDYLYEIICLGNFSDYEKSVLSEKIIEFNQDKTNLSKHLNTFAKSLLKGTVDKEVIKENIRNFFQQLVNSFVPSPRSLKFDQVELFVSVFSELLWQSKSGKYSIAKNDFYDLTNLIYVQPGNKYLSFDKIKNNKKWFTIFYEANMIHYIYKVDEVA